jgi:hypothetical protein
MSKVILPKGFSVDELKKLQDKLSSLYTEWIGNFKEKNLEKAKEFTVYFCRDISMNFVTTKFRLVNPIQESNNEEVKYLSFMEVRRILNWMLHGKDAFNEWSAIVDTDLKTSLMENILKETKKMLIDNGYPEGVSVTFGIENSQEKGNYTVRIFKPKTGDLDKSLETSKTKTLKNKPVKKSSLSEASSKNKLLSTASKDIPSAEVMEAMLNTVELIMKQKDIKVTSQGQKNVIAMQLCQTAFGLM